MKTKDKEKDRKTDLVIKIILIIIIIPRGVNSSLKNGANTTLNAVSPSSVCTSTL